MSYPVYGKLRRMLCAAMSIIIMLSLCGCSPAGVRRIKLTDTVESQHGNAYHSLSAKSEILYESDSRSFVLDSENYAVSVNDKNTHQSFDSLCIAENTYACAAEMTVVYGGIMYTLNTQDNSVAFGTASCEKTENGMTVTYGIKAEKDGEVLVTLKLNYAFSASSMRVTADMAETVIHKKAVLLTLGLLPYFGYQSSPSTQDYFLVPDGCGALMYTSLSDGVSDSLSLPVYGNNGKTSDCICPVFGIKTGNSAVCAVIDGGASLACICASRKTDDGRPAHIYPEFEITSAEFSGSGVKAAEPYRGVIGTTYIFLGGASADYSGMAGAARECLIADGILPREAVHTDGAQFNLTVPAYVKKTASSAAMSVAFDDAQALLGILKGKSVNNINLIYDGIFSGGVMQKTPSSLSVLKEAGGIDGLEELYSYTSANNVKLIAVQNAASSYASSFKPDSAKTAGGKKLKSDTLLPNGASAEYELACTSFVKNNVPEMLKAEENLPVDGLCIRDIGGTVYPDMKSDCRSREDTASVFSSVLSTVGNSTAMFVRTGNFYSLKNADFILDIPFAPSVTSSVSYEAVPFVQMILHGCIPYSPAAVNLQSDMKTYMLRCIEYGCVPDFEWTFNQGDSLYYGNTLGTAVEFYEKTGSVLNGLDGVAVKSREKVTDGVYCVRYDNGAVIYVNYNSYSVAVPNGLTVMALDCLRIG